MTESEALKHAKKELEAYKLKVANGRDYYQNYVDFWTIVIDALEERPKKIENLLQEMIATVPEENDFILTNNDEHFVQGWRAALKDFRHRLALGDFEMQLWPGEL